VPLRASRQLVLRAHSPAGFTLVELLVASTLGLVIMASLASLFGLFSRSFSQSRDISDLAAQMRSAAWQLRRDLQGATADLSPWIRPESNAGYFELIEGPFTDTDAAAGTSNLRADVDDVLLFTTHSPRQPFVGRFFYREDRDLDNQLDAGEDTNGNGALDTFEQLESPYAEVAWFCKPSANMIGTQPLYTLYRRQLLVVSQVGAADFAASNSVPFVSWPAFYADKDLSCRREGATLVPNSLADLSKRECRFLHNLSGVVSGGSFPYEFPRTQVIGSSNNAIGEILDGNRNGEDVVLRNVLAFDVRAFDGSATGVAAYVDLGVPSQGNGSLSSAVSLKSKLTVPTFDTWSMHYEFNGIDDDALHGVDQGTDGADLGGSSANGAIDDESELETAPPYSVALRGVEIRIRCVEPSSNEIRQITIRHSFVGQ
jgi:prepilin-type N-terminal cleavage/methylation domain-containing protein